MFKLKILLLGAFMLLTQAQANSLSVEQSPYLLQHKDNPVDWHAWSKDSLDKALKEDKLIFLSIGYSTCHWCHVMEEESFENDDVAKALNQNYISIKVDREEMPQLDQFYQSVYQIMNRRGGGWPLTIIMTPDRKAFWSGTYIPKKNLIKLLTEVTSIYKSDKQKILDSAKELHAIATKSDKTEVAEVDLDVLKVINKFTQDISESFDEMNGGQGAAPKFPRASMLEAMLDLYTINDNKKLLIMAETTLKGMANGGIYDQIESGFYRYSVDGQWLIPHYEKMLYTQSELLRVYSKAYAITKDSEYKKIVDDLVSFVEKRFEKDSLLYSASDADSLTAHGEKEEGHYFVFRYDETEKFLLSNKYSTDETKSILEYFNITKDGNFEHSQTNPNIIDSKPIKNLDKIKSDLEKLRSQKTYPFVDHKIQTSWNAMYISALFVAAKNDERYAQKALKLLDSLLDNMYIDKTLYHQKLIGKPLKVKALFEDYAFLIDALNDAYMYSYDKHYISLAKHFATKAINKFYKGQQWYLSDDEFKSVSSIYDSAYSSPSSIMTRALFKLSTLTDDIKLYALAEKSIKQNARLMQGYPSSIATAFDTFVGYHSEFKVLKADKKDIERNREKINSLNNPYLLNKEIDVDGGVYLGCTINRCFSTEKDINSVLAKIEEYSKL